MGISKLMCVEDHRYSDKELKRVGEAVSKALSERRIWAGRVEVLERGRLNIRIEVHLRYSPGFSMDDLCDIAKRVKVFKAYDLDRFERDSYYTTIWIG